MADIRLNQFLARGTAAARAAFTPSPPATGVGPTHAYLWWETDTARLWAWDGAAWVRIEAAQHDVKIVGIVIDGGGSAITTGVKGFVRVNFTGTITKWTVLSIDGSATSGSIVVDVWKNVYASYPPVGADSITASAKPTLSAANKAESSTLTGWTTSVTTGDVFGFHVDSATTVTRVCLELEVSL